MITVSFPAAKLDLFFCKTEVYSILRKNKFYLALNSKENFLLLIWDAAKAIRGLTENVLLLY